MSDTQIRLENRDGSAVITLRTEAGLNVMSSRLLRDLRGALRRIAEEGTDRNLVVRGEGKVFAAGADIKEMEDFSVDQARDYAALGQAVLDDLASMPLVTVASINGPALGGGLELALACDFRIAVKSAKIGLPETSLGLIPGWSGIRRLQAVSGPSAAKKIFLSALPISAEEGVPLGLIDEVVNSQEDLEQRVPAFCNSFRRASPRAVALAKRAARTGDDLSAFADCFGTEDAREGISAFLQKRTARWMEQS